MALSPTKTELLDAVVKSLDESIKVLNALPRLIQQTKMLPHLRDGGVNLPELFEDGPQLYKMVRCTRELDDIQKHIDNIDKTLEIHNSDLYTNDRDIAIKSEAENFDKVILLNEGKI